MDGDLLWAAFALVLIFEGILPLIAPAAWRQAFMHLVGLRDGQLRFFGLCAVLAGFALLALAGARFRRSERPRGEPQRGR